MWWRILLWTGAAIAGLLLVLAVGIGLISEGVGGERLARGRVEQNPVPADRVLQRAARQSSVAPDTQDQILFGDLHVHTTYSGDAFLFSLPLFQGEGAHPPADACDFARFCAELDFWSINDHAEFLAPWQWGEIKESIRECNDVAGDPESPDLVSFLGWEWTQASPVGLPGSEGQPHFGHKNVIFLDTEEERVPARPIGAGSENLLESDLPAPAWAVIRAGMAIGDLGGDLSPYLDFNRFARDVREAGICDSGVPVRELPPDCLEGAPTPDALFGKLDDWGFPSLVIPHGTTWGIHAPPESHLGTQLEPGRNDASRQKLFEVYSGHGNSEAWRAMVDTETSPDGEVECAAPSDGYLPCCWRAGEIIAERCTEENEAPSECAARGARARREFVAAGPGPRALSVVPGTAPADWLDCGQLPGGFLPALDYRPGMSAQYGLAVRNPDAGPENGAFRYGLIASSDNHKARPGPGYKETARKSFSDAYGLRQDWIDRVSADPQPRSAEPIPADLAQLDPRHLDPGTERNASYYYTAGLVAVHAADRSRTSIWDALASRRVYGTSGPRILLWFDFLDPVAGPQPMGSEVFLPSPEQTARFRVRASGSFEQQPGCPAYTRDRLSPERLERICRGECYHPGDRRHPIEAIEVVRIRPQTRVDEPIADLVDDPWKILDCPGKTPTCSVEFEDPDYDGSREFLYYVRALQAPTPVINGNPMDCQRDADGRCREARLCPAGGPGYDPTDECLSPARERAWSSPIWLRPEAGPGSAGS